MISQGGRGVFDLFDSRSNSQTNGPATPAGAPRLISARKYQFTPELLGELRLAYCGNKRKLSSSLDRLARLTGWPRHAFQTEARRLGETKRNFEGYLTQVRDF